MPDLKAARSPTADLLDTIRALALSSDGHVRRPVDYSNLGAEELGSVYESLLELHPVLNTRAGTFELAPPAATNARPPAATIRPPASFTCLARFSPRPGAGRGGEQARPEASLLAAEESAIPRAAAATSSSPPLTASPNAWPRPNRGGGALAQKQAHVPCAT